MISLNLKKFVPSPVKGQLSHVKGSSGFTLLELLIVIAIIAILSIALVFMLNPAETLKKARDAQRISDLKSVKTALGIMLTASSTPSLDNFGATPVCLTQTTWPGVTSMPATAKIAYSYDGTSMTAFSTAPSNAGATDAATTFSVTPYVRSGGTGSAGKVDGTGWIPVSLKGLTGGTPIASFPTDPVNTIGGASSGAAGIATSTDLVYRYACQNGTNATYGPGKPAYTFEINAVLESNAYTVDDNKMKKDGGDNDNMYESGNSLNLLPLTAIGF